MSAGVNAGAVVRRSRGEPTPWGKLYQSPVHGSVVLADQAYYDHHERGSQQLAQAIGAYLRARG